MKESIIHVKSASEFKELNNILEKLGEKVNRDYVWTERWEFVYFHESSALWSLTCLTPLTSNVMTLDEFKILYGTTPSSIESSKNKINSSNIQDKKNNKSKIINPKITKMANTETNVERNSQEIEFDLERLASEIDAEFQETFNKYTGEATDFFSKKETEYKKLLEKNYEKQQQKIDDTVRDYKEELMQEILKSRAIINVTNPNNITTTINVDHLAHPIYEKAISSLIIQKKLMLVGPAGTGKTYMVKEFAKSLSLPFYKYSCSRDSSVHDLLGYKQPTSEEYLNTVFLNCYENGGIFLVDEFDSMSADMALFFNGVSDSSDSISIPHRDNNPIAYKHKDFYIVMCGNTWGRGSQDYTGRDFQDMALMDRFRLSKFYVDYHTSLEQQLCKQVGIEYAKILKLRHSLVETGSYLSTRNIEDFCNLAMSGMDIKDIYTLLLYDLEESEKQVILQSI